MSSGRCTRGIIRGCQTYVGWLLTDLKLPTIVAVGWFKGLNKAVAPPAHSAQRWDIYHQRGLPSLFFYILCDFRIGRLCLVHFLIVATCIVALTQRSPSGLQSVEASLQQKRGSCVLHNFGVLMMLPLNSVWFNGANRCFLAGAPIPWCISGKEGDGSSGPSKG